LIDTQGCLYALTFPNGKQYIGITSGTLRRRVNLHRSHANRGRPGAIYNAIRKYGTRGFDAKVLVIASDWDYLCRLERNAIAVFDTMSPGGFNLTTGGEGAPGQIVTQERRAQISKERKGKGTGPRPHVRGWSHTTEAKRKISEAGKGREFSEETRAKIGATHTGNSYNLGSRRSDESRAKMSLAQKGRTFSDETKLKMSIAAKTRPPRIVSEETRLRMSIAAKNRKLKNG
jgi:group I intron endonuclease